MTRRHLAIATGLIALLTLAGCSSTPPASTPVASAPADPPSAAPTATETSGASEPSEGPQPFVPGEYTCESFLPPATLAVFESKKEEGFVLETDFIERVRNYASNLALFPDLGGLLCQWAYPGMNLPVSYGYSAISASDAEKQRAQLVDAGNVESQNEFGTIITNPDTVTFPDAYLFIDGYWFYASSRDMLDVITRNLLMDYTR